MDWTDDTYASYVKRLRSNISWHDAHDANMHRRIIATSKEVIGVGNPVLRQIAREIRKGTVRDRAADPEGFLRACIRNNGFGTYEETLVYGLVCSGIKDFGEYSAAIDPFLGAADTWAEIDVTVGDSTLFRNLTPEMEEWTFSLLRDDGEPFRIRFGIILLMKYFRTEKYLGRVLDACSGVSKESYYVRIAVAWLLAEYLLPFPDAIYAYLKEDVAGNPHLDRWTHNKAIQKACESFRVPDEMKTALRKLKIKNENGRA
ncbi:MAG: DNA alkylation repair protein [Bacteroidales bacterium]|jgi:3-methyladenine DNA glycosylase AlkD|nr:DNA alkylation repair protein [Bacteroidales bacterium]MCI2121720.1 DNA alkylation repair protein [Bacteroidales bacterium]MCI2145368.1 DNA alkylation repair protein [Bacteroidales bacterium]